MIRLAGLTLVALLWAGCGGTTTPNAPQSSEIDVFIGTFTATGKFETTWCIEEIHLLDSTMQYENVELPIQGAFTLLPVGTSLEAKVSIETGAVFDQIGIRLNPSCAGDARVQAVESARVENTFGSFSTTDIIESRVLQTTIVGSQNQVLEIDVLSIIEKLKQAQSNEDVAAAFQN